MNIAKGNSSQSSLDLGLGIVLLRNDNFESKSAKVMGLSNQLSDDMPGCLQDLQNLSDRDAVSLRRKNSIYIKAECVCSGWHESTILLMVQKSG